MAPSTYSSGGRTRHGGITKHGSAMLRSVLCECVLSHKRIRKDSNISEFHARIARKKGNPKATVAAGAKLLRIRYRLLTEGREYSESVESNPVLPYSQEWPRSNIWGDNPEFVYVGFLMERATTLVR